MKTAAGNQNGSSDHEHLYKDVFMNIPAATAIVSTASEVVAFNTAFAHLFQINDEEVRLPLPFAEVSSSFWIKADVQQHLQDVVQGHPEKEETVFDWQHEDGTLKYIQVQLRVLPSDASRYVLTCCDVSELKQIGKEHNLRIRHMMHELRNPLSNISLCVELLADSTKENNQEDTDMFLSKASASVQRMKQLINDLNATRKAS